MSLHSYKILGFLNPDSFTTASEQCQRFVRRQNKVEVRGWDGAGEPVFSDTLISLNGALDESHQTFQIRLDGEGTTSCNTDYKTYDLIVRACLLILKSNLGDDIEIEINDEYPSATELARALVESYIGTSV